MPVWNPGWKSPRSRALPPWALLCRAFGAQDMQLILTRMLFKVASELPFGTICEDRFERFTYQVSGFAGFCLVSIRGIRGVFVFLRFLAPLRLRGGFYSFTAKARDPIRCRP
jgi:hypothetical protein